jgi:predicted nucleic acid-binding protein
MSIVVISDTSCLIALDRINQLDLLQKLFHQIVTTQAVQEEFGKELPEWIQIVEVQNQDKIQELEAVLDKGEASAIALALETEKSQLIIDEKKGRKVAQKLKIDIIGTLKVIQMAKQKEIIQSAQPVIEGLQKAGFRFSQTIVNILLEDE